MKKIIGIIMLMAACGSGLFAQTSMNKAISVASDGIAFKAQTLTLTLPHVVLNMGNDTEQRPVLGVSNPVTFHYGYILPSVSDFMDLGSSSKYFRKIYARYLYYKNSPQQFSDARCKENIQPLGEASTIIQQLRPVTFDFKRTDSISDISELKNKVGFIAQEVQTVLPHLVGYMPDVDIYTLDYTSILPYLVKAFQEAQEEKNEMEEQMTALQDQLSSLQELVQSLLAQNETSNPAPNNAPKHSPKNTVKEAKLFQNLPNPFSQSTVIRYELPKTAGNAYLQLFDATGRIVKSISLPQAERGQVEISAGELLPGVYTYSLVVSGKVIDSKRMVVTE